MDPVQLVVRCQLLAVEFQAQQGFAMPVLPMHMEAMLAKVDADQCYVVHDGLRQK